MEEMAVRDGMKMANLCQSLRLSAEFCPFFAVKRFFLFNFSGNLFNPRNLRLCICLNLWLAGFLAALCVALFWKRPGWKAAAEAADRLGGRERMITTLELLARDRKGQ